jgi:hypothetical protein
MTKTSQKSPPLPAAAMPAGEKPVQIQNFQTFLHENNVYQAYVQPGCTILADMNKSNLWQNGNGRLVGWVQGYFIWPGQKTIFFGRMLVLEQGRIWARRPTPAALTPADFTPCCVEATIINLAEG